MLPIPLEWGQTPFYTCMLPIPLEWGQTPFYTCMLPIPLEWRLKWGQTPFFKKKKGVSPRLLRQRNDLPVIFALLQLYYIDAFLGLTLLAHFLFHRTLNVIRINAGEKKSV